MPSNNARGKKWCFTLNNYTNAEEKCFIDAVEEGTASYVIFGHEVGESGTPHLQGYIEFPQKVRLNTARALSSRAHWEKSKARNSADAINYCKKDGDWVEKGISMKQGRRTDLEDIRSRILAGASEIDIADEFFSQWCQYRRAFQDYRRLVQGQRAWKSFVHVLWGATGTGKTRVVHDLYPGEVWTYSGGGWFDGYVGQRVVLFDDFRGAEDGIPPGLFLRLCDRYPCSVPVKGSFTNWNPRKIYITSNVRPDLWFPELTFDAFEAFKRRLDKVENILDSIY